MTDTTAHTDLKNALQEYQARRLRETYADVVRDPQYTRLGAFFFDEIYGPQDFSFRNESIRTLHQHLKGLLRGDIIDGMARVIDLHDLTDRLDEHMVRELTALDARPPLAPAVYTTAYRRCGNYEERLKQIDLMLEAIRTIHRISRMRLIGLSLKAVHGAAHLAGYGAIMDFLTNGYEAFHKVRDIGFFAGTVEAREKRINDELFGRAPQ